MSKIGADRVECGWRRWGSAAASSFSSSVFFSGEISAPDRRPARAPTARRAAVGPIEQSPMEARQAQLVSFVLDTAQVTWSHLVPQTFGVPWHDAKLVLYRQATPTACGIGQAGMGPFYCPLDQQRLHRSVVLRRAAQPLRRARRVRRSVRADARARTSRSTSARHRRGGAATAASATATSRTRYRLRWSCRPTATRASGRTTRRARRFSSRATSSRVLLRRRPWATTGFSARRRVTSTSIRSRTARRRSVWRGSVADSNREIRKTATPSRPDRRSDR